MSDSYVPGSAPASIWGVPFERNPNFTGRGKQLADLREALMSKGATRKVRAITGLGGIGKTQLALEYCYKHRWDYQVIWWINAEESTNIALGYSKLARALGLNFPIETSLDEIRHVLRRVLAQRPDWLIVFDNAPAPEEVKNYLPLSPAGHVIITSRNAEWDDTAAVTVLEKLSRNDSIAFLRKRTNRIDPNEIASKLAQALGDLPLALEQAAAVISENKLSFQDYLVRFETHWAELLKRGRGGNDYPDSVAMTWEISFRALEEDSPAAAELLYFASCLGPDPIKHHFLLQSYSCVPDSLQPVFFSEDALTAAIRTLSRYSLVDVQNDSIIVHRLVSGLTRNRLPDEERHKWVDTALRRIVEAFDFQSNDVATWSFCGELVGKALAVSRYAEAAGISLVRVSSLLDSVGRYLHRTAQFEQARMALGRAMQIYESVLGEDHPKVSAVANNLGRVLTRLGENEEARWCFERAIKIDRATYGDDDPHVATVANNYGLALHVCGQIEAAREQFEFARLVYEKHYGEDHPKSATVLNNLGFISMQLNDNSAAVEYFQKSLDSAERSHHPNHPLIGSILSNLGDARRRLGAFDLAQRDLNRALQIDESAYGPVHPDIARDLQRLGELLAAMGDHDTARVHLERALSIDEQVYGPDHVLLIHRLNPLAQLHRATGDFGESQRYFERASQIWKDSKQQKVTA